MFFFKNALSSCFQPQRNEATLLRLDRKNNIWSCIILYTHSREEKKNYVQHIRFYFYFYFFCYKRINYFKMVERIRKKKDIHGWPLRTGLLFYEFISLILLLFLRRIVLCGCWRKLATIQRLRTRNILIRNFFKNPIQPQISWCLWLIVENVLEISLLRLSILFLSVFHWVVCFNKKVQGKSMLSPLLDSFGKSVGCWHQQRAASSPSKNGVMVVGGGEKKKRSEGWPSDGRTRTVVRPFTGIVHFQRRWRPTI